MTVVATPWAAPEDMLRHRTWHLDPWHSQVQFRVLHRGAGWVRGRFNRASGTIDLDDATDQPHVAVTIDTTSISTGVPLRDRNLRGREYLDAETFPQMTYTATALERTGAVTARLLGELGLHGHTHSVPLDVEWQGSGLDSDGEHWFTAFAARGHISLARFGITPPPVAGLKLLTIGDRIGLDIAAVLLPHDPADLLERVPVD